MRLSPFHIQLAKEFAEGKKNSEILQNFQISASRLSVIKANPLFKQEIERQRKIIEDRYGKAVKIMEDAAEKVAKALVDIVEDKAVSADVRTKTGENILNRIAQHSATPTSGTGNAIVFEQLLRVTKRSSGETDTNDDADLGYDPEAAYKELMADLAPTNDEPDVINVTPDPVLFTKHIPSDTPIPTIGGNGGDKHELSPTLKAMLQATKTH
ncbi:MAG: hypothetical protein WC444_06175 [Candidatus Paceibacterota bacterium]